MAMDYFDIENRVFEKIMNMIPTPSDEEELSPETVQFDTAAKVILTRNISLYIDNIEEVLIKKNESQEDYIAKYSPMQSKGKITFYWKRMGTYFWYIICQLDSNGLTITKHDLEYLCYTFIRSVNRHERFHHECDVIHQLLRGTYVRLKEEALAVACSFLDLRRKREDHRTLESQIDTTVLKEFSLLRFAYKQPGYRDWVSFRTEKDFICGLMEYLSPRHATNFLVNNGVNMELILRGMQQSIVSDGFVYKMSDAL